MRLRLLFLSLFLLQAPVPAVAANCMSLFYPPGPWAEWIQVHANERLRKVDALGDARYGNDLRNHFVTQEMDRDKAIFLDSFGFRGAFIVSSSEGVLRIEVPSIRLQEQVQVDEREVKVALDYRKNSPTLTSKFFRLLTALSQGIDARLVGDRAKGIRLHAVEIHALQVVNERLAQMLTELGFISKSAQRALTPEEIHFVLGKTKIPSSLRTSPTHENDLDLEELSRLRRLKGEGYGLDLVLRADLGP